MPEAIMITHAGRTQSISAWARDLGMAPCSLIGRLERGWSEAEAVSTPPLRRPPILVRFQGRRQNLTAWSVETGISYITLVKRYHRGDRGATLFRPIDDRKSHAGGRRGGRRGRRPRG